MFARHAHDDAAVHGHKSPIAVLGKTIVACFCRQPLDRLGRQTDIQHRVHHARHRGPGAGPDRDQQRPLRIAEPHAHRPLDPLERFQRGVPHAGRILFPVLVIFGAGLGGNREAGRNRDSEIRHFGKSGPPPTEELFHVGGPFGQAVTKVVHVFLCHAPLSFALTSVQFNGRVMLRDRRRIQDAADTGRLDTTSPPARTQ